MPVVLVTGAAGAIGAATVRAFDAAGFWVAGLDRSAADDAADRSQGASFVVDLRDEAAAGRAIAAARDAIPGGTLIHVVGIAGGALPQDVASRDDPMLLDPAGFRDSVDANLVTQFIALHAVLPWLREGERRDRSISLVSSFNALAGWGMPAYSAAKAGLIGMMHALTDTLGRDGIRINVVAPGTIRTPRTEALWAGDPAHFESLERTTALGTLGTPDDVARSLLACATALTHVTGQVLVVDGGQSVKRG